MKLKVLRKETVFIPSFGGNKDLPESEQVKVNIKSFPTAPESNSYRSYRQTGDGAMEIAYPNDALMLAKHIGGIKNLDIEGASKEEKVNNGSSLAKSEFLELKPLIDEIREYLLEASEPLTEGES
jgi:hypothetical protein